MKHACHVTTSAATTGGGADKSDASVAWEEEEVQLTQFDRELTGPFHF